MIGASIEERSRRPRFRRASEPPAFRLTDDDVQIVRELARYRFLRSTHVAALVGRSVDRTNDRLMRLFHAGYVDRPRAQLDYYPTGSAPMIYALADRGARLLIERDGREGANFEWSRRNREAGRPFIEHQIEVVKFTLALQFAARRRGDVRFISSAEMNMGSSQKKMSRRTSFALTAQLSEHGSIRRVRVIPDLVFAIELSDGTRRNFVVEIDRGTMPIVRSGIDQTSFARKMRVYLTAHAMKQHERELGWRNFRVLTLTSDRRRIDSMTAALNLIRVPHAPGPGLFFFAPLEMPRISDPFSESWIDGRRRPAGLI